jgi:hypothetical protein
MGTLYRDNTIAQTLVTTKLEELYVAAHREVAERGSRYAEAATRWQRNPEDEELEEASIIAESEYCAAMRTAKLLGELLHSERQYVRNVNGCAQNKVAR